MHKLNKIINIFHKINKITLMISLLLWLEWFITEYVFINPLSLLLYGYWIFISISVLTGLSGITLLIIRRKQLIKEYEELSIEEAILQILIKDIKDE